MLVQADKGRTTVTVYKEDYTNKIHNYLTENNIQPLKKKISSTKTLNIFRKQYNKITSSSTKGKSNTYFKKTQPRLH